MTKRFYVTETEMEFLKKAANGDPGKLWYLEENYEVYVDILAPLIHIWPSTIERMYKDSITPKRKMGWLL